MKYVCDNYENIGKLSNQVNMPKKIVFIANFMDSTRFGCCVKCMTTLPMYNLLFKKRQIYNVALYKSNTVQRTKHLSIVYQQHYKSCTRLLQAAVIRPGIHRFYVCPFVAVTFSNSIKLYAHYWRVDFHQLVHSPHSNHFHNTCFDKSYIRSGLEKTRRKKRIIKSVFRTLKFRRIIYISLTPMKSLKVTPTNCRIV